jgi:hypothetical protein
MGIQVLLGSVGFALICLQTKPSIPLRSADNVAHHLAHAVRAQLPKHPCTKSVNRTAEVSVCKSGTGVYTLRLTRKAFVLSSCCALVMRTLLKRRLRSCRIKHLTK